MGTFEHSAMLFDMHCHLGFASDTKAVRYCLRESTAQALSCTVSPEEYERDLEAFATMQECTVALGLHPWQVTDVAYSASWLARFKDLAPATRFIGEIGLDYAGNRGGSEQRELQRNVFEQVLAACDSPSAFPRKLLSIHAVRAAHDVLDLLEAHESFERHDCVFHWFAGTSDELKRSVDAGCLFSVGPRMLATKRGREYARIIPADRLLLETDSPSRPGEVWNCNAWITALEEALEAIARIKDVPTIELARIIAQTSESLLKPA